MREQLIVSAMPLARLLANRIALRQNRQSYEIEDCVGEAYLGLCRAADKYDSTRGHKFTTYAGRKINGAVLDGLRSNDAFIKTTRKMVTDNDTPPQPLSLDEPISDDAESYIDFIKDESAEKAFNDILEREHIKSLVQRLSPREKVIAEAIMADKDMLQLRDEDPFQRSHTTLLNGKDRLLKHLRRMI